MKRVLCLLAGLVFLSTVRAADPPLVGVLQRLASEETVSQTEISVIFQEPVSTSSLLTLENYQIPGASLTQLRLAATNRGVILSANPLQEGFSSMLFISGMVDNSSTSIPNYNVPLEVTNRVWTPIGGNELGFIPEALAVNTNGFDLFSGGIQQVDDYDEATFVGQQLEGDFDQVVRVHSVDRAGRGAKAGIMVRESLDVGVGRPVDPEDPTTMFSRYIELAINATTSADNQPGFGGHRIFMRPSKGDPFLQSLTVTNDAVPQFTNVGSSRVDLQACKLEYSIVSPK